MLHSQQDAHVHPQRQRAEQGGLVESSRARRDDSQDVMFSGPKRNAKRSETRQVGSSSSLNKEKAVLTRNTMRVERGFISMKASAG